MLLRILAGGSTECTVAFFSSATMACMVDEHLDKHAHDTTSQDDTTACMYIT